MRFIVRCQQKWYEPSDIRQRLTVLYSLILSNYIAENQTLEYLHMTIYFIAAAYSLFVNSVGCDR